MAREVDGLIEQLRSGGVLDGEGGFTLDREKAREKLRQFQLADPRSYVLLLVSAAVMRGATRIDVRIDADDLHLRFDRSFDAADLDALYTSLFGAHDDASLRPRQELALALNAAMALDPAYARVTSADERGVGVRLTVRPDDTDELETDVPGLEPGTHVHVKDRFRARTVVRFFRNIRGTIAEVQYLREKCVWSPVPITLDGRLLTEMPSFPDALAQTEVEVPGGRAWLALVDGDVRPSEVELVVAGVDLGRLELPEAPTRPRVRAVVQTNALRKDVSQTAVVRDRDHEAVLRAVRQGLFDLLAMVLPRLEEIYGGFFSAPTPLQDLVRGYLVAFGNAVTEQARNPITKALSRLPVWRTLDGRVRSTFELVEKGRGPDYVTEGFAAELPEAYRDLVLVDPPSWMTAFRAVSGERGKNRTAEVELWVRRERARRAFLERHHPPRVGETACLARQPFRSGVSPSGAPLIEGEVALLKNRASAPRFVIVKDGCALWELSVTELPIGGLVVVVQAPVQPAPDFDRAEPNEALAAAVLAASSAVHTLMHTLIASGTDQNWLGYVATCLVGGLEGLLLQCFGFEMAQVVEHLLRHEPHPLAPRRSDDLSGQPWARAALFESVDGRMVSAAEIEQSRGHSRSVFVVSSNRQRSSGLQDLVCRSEGPLRDAVLTGARELQLLRAVFGEKSVVNLDGIYRRVLSRQARRARSTDPLEPRAACSIGPRTFTLPGARVAVGLGRIDPEASALAFLDSSIGPANVGKTRDSEGASVRVLTDHRDVCDIDVPCPLRGVAAAIDIDDLETNVEHTELAGRSARNRVAQALYQGVTKLLEALASADTRDDAERVALLEALAVLVPGDPWPRVHRLLRTQLEASAAREELGALFELVDRVGPQLADDVLRSLVSSDVLPTAAAVEAALTRRREVREVPAAPLGALRRGILDLSARIEALPLLPALGGMRSLAEVWAEIRRHGRVAYARTDREPIPRQAVDRLVLALGSTERQLAERLFGADALEDATSGILEAAARQSFERRAELAALELSADEALVTVNVDQDQMKGQLGLPLEHPEAATTNILVCHGRRPITRISPPLPVPLVGVIAGERFGVHTGFERLWTAEEDLVARLCQRSLHAVWKALADAYDGLPPNRRPLADAWVLHALRLHGRDSRARRTRLQGGTAVLLDLPVLCTLGGERISFEGLRRAHGDGPIPICDDPELPPGPEPVVVVDRLALGVLAAVFGELRDHAQAVAEHERVEQRRRAARPLPEPPEDALVVEVVDGRGLRGRLWIDPRNIEDARVAFGQDGRVVQEDVVSALLACRGAIEGPGVEVSEAWDEVKLGARRRELLMRTVLDMYDGLAERHAAELTGEIEAPEPSLRQRMRALVSRSPAEGALVRVLRLALVRMHAEVRQGRVWSNERHRKLYRKLQGLPLLEVEDGHRISLEVALRESPMALDDADLWDVFAGDATPEDQRAGLFSLARLMGSVLDSVARSAPRPEPERGPETPRPEAEPAPGRRVEPKPKPQPKREPEPEPEPPSRETLLLDAIRAELRMVRGGNLALVGDAHLDMLHFVEASTQAAAYTEAGQIVLNRSHRAVARALEAFDRDPVWVSFLASAVYSSLNAWLAEITDADEIGFHRAHAVYVTTRGA
jgi:hypothetical protein